MALSKQHLAPIASDAGIPLPLHREHVERPSWLLTPYAGHPAYTWVVVDTGDKPNRTIRFNVALPGGKQLANYPHLLDSIMRVTFGVRTGPLMSIESGTTQEHVANNLITVARWMLSNNIERFEDLTLEDVREYAETAPFGVHAILNAEAVLDHYCDTMASLAGFEASDTKAERRAKAIGGFPARSAPSGDVPLLDRRQLLARAGLGGLGSGKGSGAMASILDEIEASCEFASSHHARLRSKCAPSPDELDGEVVTTHQLQRLLMPFEYLFRHRRYLEDAMQVPPFPQGNAGKLARALGREVGRTGTVPVLQAATFLERSVRWVLDYAPLILETKEWADSLFDENPATCEARVAAGLSKRDWPGHMVSSPYPLLTGHWKAQGIEFDELLQPRSHRQGMTLPAAMSFLVTACASVIAAFSARRASEVLGLKEGCIRPDESGRSWLNVFIHKTGQGDSVVPVPEVVVAAVSVLERLSRRARRQSGTSYIMQYNLPGSDVCVGLSSDRRPVFRLGSHLRQFGYFVDVPALADGTRWTFRPHQFRRFFAILYIWIYELGDLHALSAHLRHFDPEMTRRYVADDELGHIIAVANREHTAAILASAAIGTTQVSGALGLRLKEAARRLYVRMNQEVQVVSERTFAQRLLRFVERAGISLHALPWGYCAGAGAKSADGFRCASSAATSPDFGRATVSTCGKCAFNLRTGAAAPYLTSSMSFHKRVCKSPDAPEILRRASSALITELADCLSSVRRAPESMRKPG